MTGSAYCKSVPREQECPSGVLGIPPVVRFNIVEHNDIGIGCCETYSIFRAVRAG